MCLHFRGEETASINTGYRDGQKGQEKVEIGHARLTMHEKLIKLICKTPQVNKHLKLSGGRCLFFFLGLRSLHDSHRDLQRTHERNKDD